ncbi:MAG: hypothetical protein ACK55I_04945, partial [bacterium]
MQSLAQKLLGSIGRLKNAFYEHVKLVDNKSFVVMLYCYEVKWREWNQKSIFQLSVVGVVYTQEIR